MQEEFIRKSPSMHGLINFSFQRFLQDTYGEPAWRSIATGVPLDGGGFEAMLSYPASMTEALIGAASDVLGKPRNALLEDMGTYLISAPKMERPRRLLRFGGPTFEDFLYSLEELPDRARLAVPDLVLPELDLLDHGKGNFTLLVRHELSGFGHVMVGLLRAMADDYGALAVLEHLGRKDRRETIEITLLETGFACGREFHLTAAAS